ncbi:MAG: acetyl-CoA hydrolase/transferase C-terminal domain-containing protein [Syntrophobacteraceae bacterium]|jgi:4-hydroxybutyrate CoA-transferase
MDWKEEYKKRLVSLQDAARQIKSGEFVGSALAIGACSPDFYDAILDRWEELRDVIISDCVQVRPSRLYDVELMTKLQGHINFDPSFGMPLARKLIETRMPDFYIEQSHDLGDRYGRWSDVYVTQVTPPNEQGWVNLGLTNFYTMQAIRDGRASGKQRLTIGEVNDQQPVVFGDNWLHVTEFDLFFENSKPIPTLSRPVPGERDKKIGEYVLELIKDGDTIQMGIGSIPEAVVAGMEGKHDIGIHTEMFPIGLPQLVEKGIVTNAKKPFHKGITIATFCAGDQSMYDFVHMNPMCQLYPVGYTNSPSFVAQFPNLVAINMALMIDLSGQIASEGLGHRMVSGSGGQLDFQFGAFHSKGGRGITVMSSSRLAKDGSLLSSIVGELPPGTPITVPRSYACYVVTEYGIADLRYKSRRQRAEALINIAHPDLRSELRQALRKNFYYNGPQAVIQAHA